MTIYILLDTINSVPYIIETGSMQDCITAGVKLLEDIGVDEKSIEFFKRTYCIFYKNGIRSIYIREVNYGKE